MNNRDHRGAGVVRLHLPAVAGDDRRQVACAPDGRLTRARPEAGMTRFVAQRLVSLVLTLFVASIVIYGALYLAPGDPATLLAGGHITPGIIAEIHKQYHLDDPVCVRYWDWLSGFLRGDLGQSFVYREPVTTLLSPRIGNTLFLVSYASLLILLVGIGLGIVGRADATDQLGHHRRHGRGPRPAVVRGRDHPHHGVRGGPRLVPGVRRRGRASPTDCGTSRCPPSPWRSSWVAYVAQLTRTSIREELVRDHVETARSRGIPENLRRAPPRAAQLVDPDHDRGRAHRGGPDRRRRGRGAGLRHRRSGFVPRAGRRRRRTSPSSSPSRCSWWRSSSSSTRSSTSLNGALDPRLRVTAQWLRSTTSSLLTGPRAPVTHPRSGGPIGGVDPVAAGCALFIVGDHRRGDARAADRARTTRTPSTSWRAIRDRRRSTCWAPTRSGETCSRG